MSDQNNDKKKEFQKYIKKLGTINSAEIALWLMKNGWKEKTAKSLAAFIEKEKANTDLLREKLPELFE